MTDWIKCNNALPEGNCKVLAKFSSGQWEKVYFCIRPPHWWYVDLKGRKPVIQDDIVEWKYLTMPKT